ncbi:hypothetical protein [Butyrivibrio sp. INlla18]|uniref:hypothetical protein n=1 Tax=Butyrivibrio sp. INlla18 TaxID=1520806 RepID=UPI00115FA4AA|nr:hypothetical protein [Butyrivibrio sp. INlla18]
MDKAGRSDLLKELKKTLLDPTNVLLVATLILVTVMTSATPFTWWDDINFWSSDAKQLFFMNGFPGKYGNVSPEFGDYPPVTSIFKWLFLQLGMGEYRESLQFAGYFALNALFLMPLFGRIKKTRLGAVVNVLGFAVVVMLPGVFNGIIYYGTPADITMGIIYGVLLLTMLEGKDGSDSLLYVKIAAFTAVLFLTKSVGIEWAVFALIFYILICKKDKKIFAAAAFSGITYGSWLIFCLINRRVAKLTGAGLKMATSGNYTAPQNAADKARFFVEGFLTMPMHADRNLTLDISVCAGVVILFAFLFVLSYKKIMDASETKKVGIFLLITGIITYGIIFLAHISIFQTEDQYLDAYAMAVSMGRYGFPFLFGGYYLLMGALFSRLDEAQEKRFKMVAVIATFAFVLLTADYAGIYKHLNGYRKDVSKNKAYNQDMVGDDGRIIVDKVLADKSLWGKRVLVIRDGHTYHWVHDTYISKEASPVALVYDSFKAEEDNSDTMMQKIISDHASYIYVEDEEKLSEELFAPLMSDGQEFEPGIIYEVNWNNGGILLSKKTN